ncbi:uncharacterized protein N7484_005220 [Penicillium longicatenatum]|uniref:uncharacterized protein n=1 Tax=Penicillium longicatenatum TaxID=1561947 RepID=UPI002547C5C8|nr:uncharacterized protein N7484_005220 [Penicillium longicatenatum]KAJ5651497.1 hypothetical protein N7484_005220 [Penicillium longicatenatum]
MVDMQLQRYDRRAFVLPTLASTPTLAPPQPIVVLSALHENIVSAPCSRVPISNEIAQPDLMTDVRKLRQTSQRISLH